MHRSLRQLRPLVPKAPLRLSPLSRHNHQHAPTTSSSSSAAGSTPNLNSGEPQGSRTTHFGFKTVPEEQKEDLVRNVFESVASSYDVMNDAMSLGVHRLWKDEFVSRLQPGARGAKRCIDVAGGTGDIALRILDYAREKHADRETSVDVVDINGEMLKEGFKRFKKTMYHNSAFTLLTCLQLFVFRDERDSNPLAVANASSPNRVQAGERASHA